MVVFGDCLFVGVDDGAYVHHYLCINVHDISLYINCVFIVVAHVLSLLWQLKVSIFL